MKTIPLIIAFSFAFGLAFAQTEKPANKTITDTFTINYNNDDYEAIFSMFSAKMQQVSPLEKTNQFLRGLKKQAGKINYREFLKYENGSYATYKTAFEFAVLSLNISIDAESKINGLFIKPFVAETPKNTTINALSDHENSITKNQTNIIFENSKVFPNQTQLAFAFIKNGAVTFYGIQKNKDTIIKVDNSQSIFEIGSITKVFTSTLLADFIVNKQLALGDTINNHLDFTFHENTKITFKELANHTSGLPSLPSNLNIDLNPENPYKAYTEKELEEYLTNFITIQKSSRGFYQYSNLGAGLLGYTLGKMRGSTFDSLLQEHIFLKYKMLNSTSSKNKLKGTLVKGLNTEGHEVPNWELSVLAGAGGILSNVEDLSKFALAQFDASNKALTLTRQQTFDVNDNMSVGLGWHILNPKSDTQQYWHNGGTGGYSSSMVVDTKNKNGVIILSNVSAFNPNMKQIDKLCFEIMETLSAE
jgi:CubicO group peptidase (beta-lactamase class C family)